MTPEDTDILVVGAGPAGLHAAFYAAFRGLNVTVLEAGAEPGGQLATLYPDKRVYDVPGLAGARGAEIVAGLLRPLGGLPVTLRLGEVASGLQAEGSTWVVETSGGQTSEGRYRAGAVILAAGLGALLPRRPQLPAHAHPDVRTGLPDPATLAGRHVLLVGGVPQATRAALELAAAGVSVTLTHRRAGLRGSPAELAALAQAQAEGQLRVYAPAQLSALGTSTASLQVQEQTVDVPADTVIVLNGFLPDLSPLQSWPLAWDGEYVPDRTGGRTALSGVFVAGDLARSGADLKLISVALAQAAVAANHAVHHVRPELKVRPGHSTERRLDSAGSG
ncbi:NAD(P)/FAD-dependent oxidoreductase [Deinococcus koreensis]|uniref:Ferredoxin--NADP reductase n=1 Tax=Deinococcus koreensis TaxID=2054903 RepID=A0A2K3V1M3_9DEIO|nr:NAD(P)/FAD-dependent oxidoreductase [Deinococcus koreensis]PNY82673.1 ferredoxin-NADP reductase [Deinococcus koreensis]